MDTTTMNEKKYELRTLASKDVFPMFRIISKIGVKEFKQCFESEAVKEAIASNGKKNSEDALKAVGIAVVTDMAGIVISNVGNAENEIYSFLSGLSGMTRKELEELDMVTFFEMIVDVFKKDEFKDFIGGVSKLFN